MEKEKAVIARNEETKQTKKIKLQWDDGLINELTNKLNSDKENYTIVLTNYTCLIDTDYYSYHFLKHLQRPVVFSVNRELKRHMDTQLKQDIDYIDGNTMKYYSARVVSKPFYKAKAYNIDINAAYPSCLLVSGMIDENLFRRLMTLTKDERLAAIGMLAARQRVFTINSGEVVEYNEHESPYSKYFFHCVKTISNIIWECEIISGMSFIHSWVDGLYITDKKCAVECKKMLSGKGYKSTIAEIQDLQYTPFADRVNIKFSKGGENKVFNIPIEHNSLARILKFIHYDIAHDKNNEQTGFPV